MFGFPIHMFFMWFCLMLNNRLTMSSRIYIFYLPPLAIYLSCICICTFLCILYMYVCMYLFMYMLFFNYLQLDRGVQCVCISGVCCVPDFFLHNMQHYYIVVATYVIVQCCLARCNVLQAIAIASVHLASGGNLLL